jgi:hypothetical protein
MQPLTAAPVYFGLWLSLVLALVCNAFLDIRYGSFAFETGVWAVLMGGSLWLAWRQQGVVSDAGRRAQTILLWAAGGAFLLLFLPIWRLPQAGVYLLAALQAASNCTAVTRRKLYQGMTVALVLVLYASAHYRANWSMLFYLIPFLVVAVFTLVADQISQHHAALATRQVGHATSGGQWLAIASASGVILLVSLLLYLLTPQPDWGSLNWRYGQASNTAVVNAADGNPTAPGQGGGAGSSNGTNGAQGSASRGGDFDPAQMRTLARQPGLPGWQASAINALADVVERLSAPMQSLKQLLKHLLALLDAQLLLILLALALLAAAAVLLREVRPLQWLRIRLDYLLLWRNQTGKAGAYAIYRASERLFARYGTARANSQTVREFHAVMARFHPDSRAALTCIGQAFEAARYGGITPDTPQLRQARAAYYALYRNLTG